MKHNLYSALYKAKALKEIEEIRGKEYTRIVHEASGLFEEYFMYECKKWEKYTRENPFLFEKITAEPLEKNFLSKFLQGVENFLKKSYELGRNFLYKQIQVEIPHKDDIFVNDSNSLEYAHTRAGDLIKDIDETSKRRMQALIARALEEKWTKKEMVEAIQREFTSYGKVRATLIAGQETAMAHEYAQHKEFRQIADEMGLVGWKRSHSQGDGRVRPTHRQNELDGWIRDDEKFSGTETIMAPHGFRCRCVTMRRLLEPSIDEKLEVYYKKVDLPNIGDAVAGDLTKITKNIQSKLPWLPPLDSISWKQFSDVNIMGGFIPRMNIIILNPQSLEEFGFLEMKETIDHEYGHVIVNFLRKYPEENINGRLAKDIYQEIFDNGERLLNETDEALQKAFEYPHHILRTNTYEGIYGILTNDKALKLAQEEVFAEAVRYRENNQGALLPDYYQKMMDFIFDDNSKIDENIKKHNFTWKRRQVKRFELSGKELEWLLDQYQKDIEREEEEKRKKEAK